MCIFPQPVVAVSDTNIFARLDTGNWQYLVYQMQFHTAEKNAIILPIPIAQPAQEKESLEFISLEEYPSFFKDLRAGFPLARPTRRLSRGAPIDSVKEDTALEVQQVGDFIASFVPTMADFRRLDVQFRVSQQSWDRIPKYKDYGFAVFQLQNLRGKPHPMAFKFRSRLHSGDGSAELFFPTVHIHDGEVHAMEHFDHTLYLQDAAFDKACGQYQQKASQMRDNATGYVRSKWKAKEFTNPKLAQGVLNPSLLVHQRTMRGNLKNDDVLVAQPAPGIRERFGQSLFGGLSLGAVGLAAYWFLDRRQQVRRSNA